MLVRERGVTVLNCVPALLDMLLVVGQSEKGAGLGDAVRLVLLGGDWVGVDLPGSVGRAGAGCRFVGLGAPPRPRSTPPVRGGGRGRAGALACRALRHPTAQRGLPGGWTTGQDRPDWAVGEVWIGGAGVARVTGATRNAPRPSSHPGGVRWYRTGDWAATGRTARWSSSAAPTTGEVAWVPHRAGEGGGRTGAQPGVRRAVARLFVGRGGSLQAVVAGDPGLAGSALRDGVGEALPGYMVPELIVVVAELRLPATGNRTAGRSPRC